MITLAEIGIEDFLRHLLAHPPELVAVESRGWEDLGVPLHAHQDFYQLDCFFNGRGYYEISGYPYEIKPETCFFLSCPGQMHAIKPQRTRRCTPSASNSAWRRFLQTDAGSSYALKMHSPFRNRNGGMCCGSCVR